MRTPHILIVTGHYDIGEQVDEREYEIKCPGLTDGCRLWIGCNCPESEDSDRVWDDQLAHDVEHQQIDDEWMVATDHCVYVDPRLMDSLPDVASELRAPGGHGRGLDAGRYPIQPHWLGEGEFELKLVDGGESS